MRSPRHCQPSADNGRHPKRWQVVHHQRWQPIPGSDQNRVESTPASMNRAQDVTQTLIAITAQDVPDWLPGAAVVVLWPDCPGRSCRADRPRPLVPAKHTGPSRKALTRDGVREQLAKVGDLRRASQGRTQVVTAGTFSGAAAARRWAPILC